MDLVSSAADASLVASQEVTLPASTAASRVASIDVIACVLMPGRTVRLFSIASGSPEDVLLVGDCVEVRRLEADRVLTEVIHDQAVRDLADPDLVRGTVYSHERSVFIANLAVATRRSILGTGASTSPFKTGDPLVERVDATLRLAKKSIG